MKTARTSKKPTQPASKPSPPSEDAGGARWGSEIQSHVEQGALKRFAILRTAAELFNEHGFHETSLNELAKRLNVTKPSLYYYVKNKEDILHQILKQVTTEFAPAMTKAREADLTGLEKLKIFVLEYTAGMTGVFGKCMVLSGLGPLEPSSREELTVVFRDIDTFVRKLLDEGIRDGSIAPCDTKITAFSLFGAMHWLAKWHQPGGDLSSSEIGEKIFAVFESGLKAPGNVKRLKR